VKLRIGRSVVGHPIKESEMAYIVLIEDDKDVAEVVCDALRAEGHPLVIRSKAGAEHFVRPDLVVGLTAGWRRRPAAGETIGLGNGCAPERFLKAKEPGFHGLLRPTISSDVTITGNAIELVEAAPRFPNELLERGDRLRIGRHAQNCVVTL